MWPTRPCILLLLSLAFASSAHANGGDTCATAMVIPWPLPPGGYTDSGTTNSPLVGDQYHTNDCNGDDGRAKDVVYKITPEWDTVLIVTGCPDPDGDGTPGGQTGYDGRSWVYEGCCPGDPGCIVSEPLTCSDDGCGAFAGPPTMIFPVQAQVTYYYVQDGWGTGTTNRGPYGLQVSEVPPSPNCDRFNVCTDNRTAPDTDQLGDRYYLFNDFQPPSTSNPAECADVGACPNIPFGLYQCDPGLLLCTGFFCDALGFGCDAGTAGSPSRIPSDLSEGRGGLDNSGFEGFWGLDDVIGGLVVWGEDVHIDTTTGLPTTNCTKTQFRVTYYHDADGAPGEIAAGPFDVSATSTCVGVDSCILSKFSMAHDPVCLKRGWVSVQGLTDPDDPLCEFIWGTTDLTQLASGRDDNHYWARNAGAMTRYRFRGALMFGLAPGEAVTGACCNDLVGSCTNAVSCAACPETSRFLPHQSCAQLLPLCGDGACCFSDGDCIDTVTQSECTSSGGTSFAAGMSCAADPAGPAGIHCPPANDACSSITPAIGGLPYAFTGRNDGATADADGCASLEEVVWEAFTLSQCSDIVLDYCGTFDDQTNPTFTSAPLGTLYSDCTCSGAMVHSCIISNTSRAGACCIDDPPGYHGNYSITFPRVPAGTWYYPVKSGIGATGVYAINVTGTACSGPCLTCNGDPEGEPSCSGGNDDCTNADPLACGDTVCGTAAAGDSDWFAIDVPAPSALTWTVDAEFPARVRIVDGAAGCLADFTSLELASGAACSCDAVSVSACVTPGTYYLVVEPEASAPVACGQAYSASAACTPGCSPVVGACCTRAGCATDSTQARCDAAHGHYQGDNTTCVSQPCPALAANDECGSEIVIPPNLDSNGMTYTIHRRMLTTHPSDPDNACEAPPKPKDASAWFLWTTPAMPIQGIFTLLAGFCCSEGGPQADTVISIYRPNLTCAQIQADPINNLLICNDESSDCGDQRAEACLLPAAANPNRTYRIQVQIKDNGGPDEADLFSFRVSRGCANRGTSPCTPPACPSGAIMENEPICTNGYADLTNAGCTPGTANNFQPIACGQIYCGTTGNYTIGGAGDQRDGDWFLFTMPEESHIQWMAQSAGDATHGPGLTAEIWRIDDLECSTGGFTNLTSVSNDTDRAPVTAQGTVGPGRYAVTVLGRTVWQIASAGDQACGTPWVASLACSSANTLPTPSDECSAALIADGPGRYSGSINTNGDPVVSTPDGESSCDGAGGDVQCCNGIGVLPDRYIKYTAACTGRVTVDACQSPSPLLLSVHTGCPARCGNEVPSTAFCDDGLGISCNTFGCGQGGGRPFITFDVVQGQTYVIRAALTSGSSGTYVVRISECVDPCFPQTHPATVTSAVSRRSNPHARVNCDTNLIPARKSEPHSGGVQEVRIRFDFPPLGGGLGASLFEATCPTGAFSASGQAMSGAVSGNELVLTFSPALTNARTYRIDLGPDITSIAGQSVFVRGLVGDVNRDGFVNAIDRSLVVGAWTGPGGWSCPTDVNNSGQTNATDRSVVVGAWTGGIATNCAP